jgi:hypothetical protein
LGADGNVALDQIDFLFFLEGPADHTQLPGLEFHGRDYNKKRGA